MEERSRRMEGMWKWCGGSRECVERCGLCVEKHGECGGFVERNGVTKGP